MSLTLEIGEVNRDVSEKTRGPLTCVDPDTMFAVHMQHYPRISDLKAKTDREKSTSRRCVSMLPCVVKVS